MDLGGALLGFVVLGQLLGAGRTTSALLTIGGVVVVTFLLTVALVREPSQSAAPGSGRVTLADAFQLDLRRHRAFVWLVASRFLFLAERTPGHTRWAAMKRVKGWALRVCERIS
jgi:hypothetical protein